MSLGKHEGKKDFCLKTKFRIKCCFNVQWFHLYYSQIYNSRIGAQQITKIGFHLTKKNDVKVRLFFSLQFLGKEEDSKNWASATNRIMRSDIWHEIISSKRKEIIIRKLRNYYYITHIHAHKLTIFFGGGGNKENFKGWKKGGNQSLCCCSADDCWLKHSSSSSSSPTGTVEWLYKPWAINWRAKGFFWPAVFLILARLFWNQILIWFSFNWSSLANSWRRFSFK